MSILTVKFIGKEYSIPEDVLTYIDLLKFTDNVQKTLASAFVRKLKNEIAKDNVGLLGDESLSTEIEQQVSNLLFAKKSAALFGIEPAGLGALFVLHSHL